MKSTLLFFAPKVNFQKITNFLEKNVLQYFTRQKPSKFESKSRSISKRRYNREGSKNKLNNTLRKMKNEKSNRNASLIKELYESFWDLAKIPLFLSFKTEEKRSQALIEKNRHDKKFLTNQRPIFLHNVDFKLI